MYQVHDLIMTYLIVAGERFCYKLSEYDLHKAISTYLFFQFHVVDMFA